MSAFASYDTVNKLSYFHLFNRTANDKSLMQRILNCMSQFWLFFPCKIFNKSEGKTTFNLQLFGGTKIWRISQKFKLVTEETLEKDCFCLFYVLMDKTVSVVLKSITKGRKKIVEIKEAWQQEKV